MPKKKQTNKEKLKASTKKFNNELKKALNTALVAAFSFLIALSWRDLVSSYLNQLTSISPLQGQFFSTLIVTIIGVVGIIVVTSFIKQDE